MLLFMTSRLSSAVSGYIASMLAGIYKKARRSEGRAGPEVHPNRRGRDVDYPSGNRLALESLVRFVPELPLSVN